MKYRINREDLFQAFMDFVMACDTIDWHALRQMLRVYGVVGKLLTAVQSLYLDCMECVRVVG